MSYFLLLVGILALIVFLIFSKGIYVILGIIEAICNNAYYFFALCGIALLILVAIRLCEKYGLVGIAISAIAIVVIAILTVNEWKP